MSIVAVFDTNILFSAIGWKGRPYQCIELARAGVVEGVTCQEILDELAEKLRSKLSFDSGQVTATVSDLLGFRRMSPISGKMAFIPADPDDDKVIECATAAGATHVVTGDRRHLLPLAQINGVHIVSAAQFLKVVADSAAHP